MLIREGLLFTIGQRYFAPNWRGRNFRVGLPSLRRKAESEEDSAERKHIDFSLHVLLYSFHSTLNTRTLSHLMTRSALASTFGGIVRPICLAVFRLMIICKYVGASTGRSCGLAPFRIRST